MPTQWLQKHRRTNPHRDQAASTQPRQAHGHSRTPSLRPSCKPSSSSSCRTWISTGGYLPPILEELAAWSLCWQSDRSKMRGSSQKIGNGSSQKATRPLDLSLTMTRNYGTNVQTSLERWDLIETRSKNTLPTIVPQEKLCEEDLQALHLARDHCLRQLAREHHQFLVHRATNKDTTMNKLANCCVLLWRFFFFLSYHLKTLPYPNCIGRDHKGAPPNNDPAGD